MMKLLVTLSLVFIASCSRDESSKKYCQCIDYDFSSSSQRPLLKHTINNIPIIVCGLSDYETDGLILGKKMVDSSFYASGFNVFECNSKQSIFSDSDFNLDRIKPHSDYLEIIRYIQMPVDTTLNYKNNSIISINIRNNKGSFTIDTTFSLNLSIYSNTFLSHFEVELQKAKCDTMNPTKYPDYLIFYSFIKAVLYYPKHSNELKELGPFDGYLGILYKDILMCFNVYEHELASNPN